MELASKNIKLDLMLLNRLARQSSVEKLVRVLKIVLTVLMVFLVILIAKQAVTATMAASSIASKMESDLQAANEAVKRVANPGQKVARDYGVIAQKNIFGEFGGKIAPAATPAAKPVSQAALILIGTFISRNEPSYAIIEDKKKAVQEVFNLNDSVFGEAKLVAIKSDRVEINRNGQIEILKLDDSPDASASKDAPPPVAGTDEFTVQETELNQALENLPLLLTQARAVPYFKDGKSIGLRLFAIKTGSLFEKIGLRNGDILKSINGNNLGDLTQAIKLFETLKQEKALSLILERDKVDKEFKYQIR